MYLNERIYLLLIDYNADKMFVKTWQAIIVNKARRVKTAF